MSMTREQALAAVEAIKLPEGWSSWTKGNGEAAGSPAAGCGYWTLMAHAAGGVSLTGGPSECRLSVMIPDELPVAVAHALEWWEKTRKAGG